MKKAIIFLLCVFVFLVPMFSSAQTLVADCIEGDTYYSFKYGFLDEYGRVKIPYIYDYARKFCDGYALVQKDDKIYYIDKRGNSAFGSNNGKYKFFYDFSEGLCVAAIGEKYGYLDTNGKTAIPFDYEDAYNFSEGIACVKQNGKYGFIDKKGNTVVEFKYESADSFKNGYARVVRNNGKYGFVDKNGVECVPAIFEYASQFSEGKAVVKLYGRYTYVNQNGYICFNPELEAASSFIDGSALIKVDGKYARIYHNGYFKIEPKYDYLSEFEGEYAVGGIYIEKDVMRYGFVDKNGNRVSPISYESIMFEDGVYVCTRGGELFLFDTNLKIIENNA